MNIHLNVNTQYNDETTTTKSFLLSYLRILMSVNISLYFKSKARCIYQESRQVCISVHDLSQWVFAFEVKLDKKSLCCHIMSEILNDSNVLNHNSTRFD